MVKASPQKCLLWIVIHLSIVYIMYYVFICLHTCAYLCIMAVFLHLLLIDRITRIFTIMPELLYSFEKLPCEEKKTLTNGYRLLQCAFLYPLRKLCNFSWLSPALTVPTDFLMLNDKLNLIIMYNLVYIAGLSTMFYLQYVNESGLRTF